MPRISTSNLKIRAGDIDQNIQLVVFYTSDYGFYAAIPDELGDKFDQLTEDQMKEYNAARKYKTKYPQTDDPHQKVVKADTEGGVEVAMKKLVTFMLQLSMKKEAVIIIEFDGDIDTDHADDPNELPQVKLEFSATYCFKVSTATGKDRYYKYTEKPWGNEIETFRTEVYLNDWRENHVIIPDTKENRAFLEDLHKALKLLYTKMKEFTATSEDVLALISKQQKLLSL